MKVCCLFGTRPEAIKMAPIIRELSASSQINLQVSITGQHREMLDQVLSFFSIKPDYDMDLMTPGQTLAELSSRVILETDRMLTKLKPDMVIVQGDTTTAFLGGLTAFYQKIKVAHVEAGLRSGNMHSPFPEEMNRVMLSRITDVHFPPTRKAEENLRNEKVGGVIKTVGNTVIDALLWAREILEQKPRHSFQELFNGIDFTKKVILVTGHRRESFGQAFEEICAALKDIAEEYKDDIEIVYPVHLNPNVQEPVFRILSGANNIHLISPLDYPNLVWLMSQAYVVLTDSGGIQEEAPSLGKPVLVMRDVTERMEGIQEGTARLVGTKRENIVTNLRELIDDASVYRKMANAVNPYGDGTAAKQIRETLENL